MTAQKRLLFLNRSFYPDVEATGQLLTELCEGLADDFDVHVICGKPLYRKVKTFRFIDKSRYRKITIWRINSTTLPKNYFITRFINLLTYFVGCFIWAFCLKKMDCVITETDPPLLASIAYLYSRIRRSVFIYYSQDIWPHAGIVNKRLTNPLITSILKAVNRFLYQKSDRIIVPGRDMKKRLEEENLLPPDKVRVVENWADPREIFPLRREDNPFLRRHALEEKFVVMYSGNIGLSQDLENVVDAADELRCFEEIVFVLIGEGALKKILMNMSSSRDLRNIKFLSYQEKKNLKFSLNAAHIHLVPLKKGMKGILVPSKVYGIMASAKPFIAAVDEESEVDQVVKEFHCGLVVRPSHIEDLKKAVLWAFHNLEEMKKMGENGKQAFENHYTRKICTQRFKKIIESTLA